MTSPYRARWARKADLILILAVLTTMAALPSMAAAKLTPASAAHQLGKSQAQLRSETGLSQSQLRRVLRGARVLGGLTDSETLRVLQDRRLISGVPVSQRRTPPDGPLAVAARKYPRKGCRRTDASVTQENLTGFRLWTYKVSKFWCWNKKRKRVYVKRGSIQDDVDIPQAAAISGWKSSKKRENNFYYRYRGSGPRGAYSTYMRTRFDYCPFRIGCSNSIRAAVRLGVRWTGSAWENHGTS